MEVGSGELSQVMILNLWGGTGDKCCGESWVQLLWPCVGGWYTGCMLSGRPLTVSMDSSPHRIRRTQSGNFNTDAPGMAEFRRGGLRATAGPRLSRTRDSKGQKR